MGAAVQPAAIPARRGPAWFVLWLFAACSSMAVIEPSPYEFMFVVVALVFFMIGLRMHATLIPVIIVLCVFNIGGLISLLPHLSEQKSVQFVVVSIYLAMTTILVAMILRDDTLNRLEAFKSGLTLAAIIASILGIVGYFDVAGLGKNFTLNARASGSFKDPNVLGAFCVLPAVFLAQDLLLRSGNAFRKICWFALIVFGGSFLSFSRGAWGAMIASIGLMVVLTYIASGSGRLRQRIVGISIVGLALLIVALVFALSFEPIADMFKDRAALIQPYDVGVTGRFGNQSRAIPELLELPNGYGPLRFGARFVEDPHNVFINAFASYGWLGGFAYVWLVVLTLFAGWRVTFVRAPWQRYAIAVWATFFIQILQGLQIDTDHWRHWYLMMGIIWGLLAASYGNNLIPARAPRPATLRPRAA